MNIKDIKKYFDFAAKLPEIHNPLSSIEILISDFNGPTTELSTSVLKLEVDLNVRVKEIDFNVALNISHCNTTLQSSAFHNSIVEPSSSKSEPVYKLGI